ncbi:HdeD family acid-resistance protein [Kluyvera genomosp. 1]|uniref:HdeD family acid-resistance protein n=1 Tax=Kluyvera genomosp. 1 TaxID=2774053 RepID=UPI000691463C|nr:HdeD family acid-resistance protein [Kluyvera genomosp. 1]
MLNINQEVMARLDAKVLEKQRNLLRFIAILMFISGVLFITFPFISGDILAMILGVVLICSSIAYLAIMIKNRVRNFWPVISGLLICLAYVVMGCLFIGAPEFGLFTIGTFLACLFALGGIIRIMDWFHHRTTKGRWIQVLIGMLDLLIAWCFINAAPQTSIMMVSLVVGIELIVSALSCWSLGRLFSK